MINYCVHAFNRGNRLGIFSEEKFANYVQRAWKKGKTPSDFSGKAKKYLLDIENRHNNHTVVRVFGGFCFIFKDSGLLITEYKLAPWVLESRPKRIRFRGDADCFASEYEAIIVKNFQAGQYLSWKFFLYMI